MREGTLDCNFTFAAGAETAAVAWDPKRNPKALVDPMVHDQARIRILRGLCNATLNNSTANLSNQTTQTNAHREPQRRTAWPPERWYPAGVRRRAGEIRTARRL